MGPNGSGKSTLSSVLAGRDEYEVTDGEVIYQGQNLLELEPEERAWAGVFLSFQYPVEIPGVKNIYLLKAAPLVLERFGNGLRWPRDYRKPLFFPRWATGSSSPLSRQVRTL